MPGTASGQRGRAAALGLTLLLLIGLLNLGLYRQLEPPYKVETRLPFSLSDLQNWNAVTGDWSFAGRRLRQGTADLGLLVSPLQLPETARIHAQLEPGTGVVFGLERPRKLAESHIVYLSNRTLVMGFLDEGGRLAVQARRKVTGATPAAVTVLMKQDDYSVLLDHTPVTQPLPRIYGGNKLGLVSADSAAIHGLIVDEKRVAVTSSVVVAEPEEYSSDFRLPLDQSWQALSGAWSLAGGALLQTQTEGFDLTLLVPLRSENTHIRVQLSHLQGVGGGLLFNVPELSSHSGGHLVRFSGRELFWGYFGENGFAGQGGVAVGPEEGSSLLEVKVGERGYSVHLNGLEVARNVLLYSAAGYAGLASSQSAVRFEALKITPLETP